jgi:hypothetical protein
MFITLKKHKEIEASLKADLVSKDELIHQLLERLVEKEKDIKELQQTLEKLEVK